MCSKNPRIIAQQNHGLCPSHYLCEPALSWDGILNLTKVQIELISFDDIYLYFKKIMRGGVFCLAKKVLFIFCLIETAICQVMRALFSF